MSAVLVKRYEAPPFCVMDALRYAGCCEAEPSSAALLETCRAELWEQLQYAVCYCELPLTVRGDVCDFGDFSLISADLARYFGDCRRAVLFAATVGVVPDRLIAKYSRVAPAKALMLQAIGAERIEALCDAFCNEWAALPSRFSPGYGDLPLEAQREVFRVLRPERAIGVCLNESLLMSPSKSVTAFLGIKGEKQ